VEAAGAGELLADFDDEGAHQERDALRDELAGAPEGLARRQSETGESSTALPRTAPLPSSRREMMRRRALGGGRAAALAANARLRGRLAAGLQIAPSAVTRELADRIRAGDELLPPLAIPPMTTVPGTCPFR
jgi:hypothetical protein